MEDDYGDSWMCYGAERGDNCVKYLFDESDVIVDMDDYSFYMPGPNDGYCYGALSAEMDDF